MILDTIKEKLGELKPDRVFYGLVNREDMEEWDYIVFSRAPIQPNKTGYSKGFRVAVVEENYIQEDYEQVVIEKLTEIHGFKLDGDIDFEYVKKPNTDIVIECMILSFAQAVKKVM